MHMVGHDHVAAHLPAVPLLGSAPFRAKASCDVGFSEHATTAMSASRDKVERIAHPDPTQPTEMCPKLA